MRTMILAVMTLLVVSPAVAQTSHDAISQEMKEKGLFSPHANFCTTSEAFLALGQGTTSGATGICVEKAERSAATFETARQTCADLGKRLPEPAEYQLACAAAGGLSISDVTDDNEWASNFYQINFGYDANNSGFFQREVAIMGETNCAHLYIGVVADAGNNNQTHTYRCVR
jgi:hypothetical protein